jgi:hypothetical protein
VTVHSILKKIILNVGALQAHVNAKIPVNVNAALAASWSLQGKCAAGMNINA